MDFNGSIHGIEVELNSTAEVGWARAFTMLEVNS